MSDAKITESEWMAELDKIKSAIERGNLTEDEYNYIDYARSGAKKILWDKLLALYNSQFNHACKSRNTLSDKYYKMRAQKKGVT